MSLMIFEAVIRTIKKFKQYGNETDKDNFEYAKLSLQKFINNKNFLLRGK